MEKEIVICAAIRAFDGYIFRGHRHFHALHAMMMCPKYKEYYETHKEKPHGEDQGFVTSLNRYVDRDEGLRIQLAAGIPSAAVQFGDDYRGELFSEDLY